MSLTQGPESRLLSLDTCRITLTELKAKCAELVILHKAAQAAFLAEFDLTDMRQTRDFYPAIELLPSIESAHTYYLTINSSFTIITFGCEAMLGHLQDPKIVSEEQLFPVYQGTCAILADTKRALERNLSDFLKTHPNIQSPSADESTRVMMRETIKRLDSSIHSLSDAQRLIIEYYELLQHTQELFLQLDTFKSSLDELAVNLRTAKRSEVPILLPQKPVLSSEKQPSSCSAEPASGDETFAKSFEDKGLFDLSGDELGALLKAKLTINSDKPTEYFDNWDCSTGSARNSLEAPLSPTLLLQYAQAQEEEVISAAPSSSAPKQPLSDELTRPQV